MKEKNKSPKYTNNRAERQNIWLRADALAGRKHADETLNTASIVMVTKGKVTLYIKEEEKNLHAGDMVLIPPACPYRAEVQEDTDLLYCRFGLEVLSELNCPAIRIILFGTGPEKTFSMLKMNPALSNYQFQLKTYLDSSQTLVPLFELKVHELFYLLVLYYDKTELADFFAPIIDHATPFRDFVANNWHKARNLNELSRMASMSKSGFIKKFKKCFHESPYQWILTQRAKHILYDIREGSTPLKVIADNYYFTSYSHFSTFCKEQYGMTPATLWKQERPQ